MAEQDKESKTEQPTGKRIADALEKGNVPLSREAVMLGSVLGMLISAWFLLPDMVKDVQVMLERFIDDPGDFRLESSGDALNLFRAVLLDTTSAILPVLLVLGALGMIATLIQNPPQIALARIEPKASNISLKTGWNRIFSTRNLVEFAKSLFKLIAVSFLAFFLFKNSQADVVNALYTEPILVPQIVLGTAIKFLSSLAVALVVLVGADFAWTKYKWVRDLRMSKQEVKDEHKQMEGDPMVKARLKSLQRDRVRRRMMDSVQAAQNQARVAGFLSLEPCRSCLITAISAQGTNEP